MIFHATSRIFNWICYILIINSAIQKLALKKISELEPHNYSIHQVYVPCAQDKQGSIFGNN